MTLFADVRLSWLRAQKSGQQKLAQQPPSSKHSLQDRRRQVWCQGKQGPTAPTRTLILLMMKTQQDRTEEAWSRRHNRADSVDYVKEKFWPYGILHIAPLRACLWLIYYRPCGVSPSKDSGPELRCSYSTNKGKVNVCPNTTCHLPWMANHNTLEAGKEETLWEEENQWTSTPFPLCCQFLKVCQVGLFLKGSYKLNVTLKGNTALKYRSGSKSKNPLQPWFFPVVWSAVCLETNAHTPTQRHSASTAEVKQCSKFTAPNKQSCNQDAAVWCNN